MGQTNASREIHLTIEAGQTQSQELFDYTSTENRITTNEIILPNALIAYDGQNLIYQPKSNIFPAIYSISIDDRHIELQTLQQNQKVLWRVLKQGQLHPLENGTEIKLGKVKLRLKEVVQEEKEITEKDIKSQSFFYDIAEEARSTSAKSNYSHQKQCRICFQNSNDKDDPLVCLCKCSGSVKYMHFSCLKAWISNHVIIKQHNNAIFMSYEQTKCQICKEIYKPQFTHEGKKYMLLDINKAPNPPYAYFQQIDDEQENKIFKVYLIGLNDEQIIIGRNSTSSVVMRQISVSRSHCGLIYKNHKLFIKDNNSKFGTLIKLQDEIQFNPIEGLSLQYESKLLTIKQKSKLTCCCAESDNFILKLSHNFQQKNNYIMKDI